MCHTYTCLGRHKYRMRIVLPAADHPIWDEEDDIESIIDSVWGLTDADIDETEYTVEDDDIIIELAYSTDTTVEVCEPYWDENGGDPGYQEVSDEVTPEDVEDAFRTLGRPVVTILEDMIEPY